MSPRHLLLALVVMAIWGTNFVVIQWGLRELEPLGFVCLRFFFSAVPAMFFVRRPAVPATYLAAYGVLLGVGQFGLLFLAIKADITPGLASLIVQMQVVFTIALSVAFLHERISRIALVGTGVAAAGLATVGAHLDASVTARGLALVLAAALCWGCANLVVKRAARRGSFGMLAFVVWSSPWAVPPLVVLSIVFEGGAGALAQSLRHASPAAWAAIAWQSAANTLFCFAAWSWLLSRYDSAIAAPYALLIPVFGMGASALVLGEPLPPWKLVAAAMVLGGIALITLVPALRSRLRP